MFASFFHCTNYAQGKHTLWLWYVSQLFEISQKKILIFSTHHTQCCVLFNSTAHGNTSFVFALSFHLIYLFILSPFQFFSHQYLDWSHEQWEQSHSSPEASLIVTAISLHPPRMKVLSQLTALATLLGPWDISPPSSTSAPLSSTSSSHAAVWEWGAVRNSNRPSGDHWGGRWLTRPSSNRPSRFNRSSRSAAKQHHNGQAGDIITVSTRTKLHHLLLECINRFVIRLAYGAHFLRQICFQSGWTLLYFGINHLFIRLILYLNSCFN